MATSQQMRMRMHVLFAGWELASQSRHSARHARNSLALLPRHTHCLPLLLLLAPKKSEEAEQTEATAGPGICINYSCSHTLTGTRSRPYIYPYTHSVCLKRHLNNFDKCVINSNILAT